MQNADRGDGTHDGHLGIGPGEHLGRSQRGRIHRDVGAAVSLARDDGDAGDNTLGERMQELGTAKGRMWIADNFDDSMPEIEAVFAGEA